MAVSHLPANVEAACREAIRECELEKFIEPLLQATKLTISCDGRDDTTGRDALPKPRVGGTKIGGYPDLPSNVPWPAYAGKFLPFVAQVNLAELPKLENNPLPPEGMLSYFCWATNEVKGRPSAVLWSTDELGQSQPRETRLDQIHADWQGESLYEEEFATEFSMTVTLSTSVAEECAKEQGLLDPDEQIEGLGGDFSDDFASAVDIFLEYGLDVWDNEEFAEEGIAMEFHGLIQLLGYPDPCDYFLYALRTCWGGHTDGTDRWQNILDIGSRNNMMWSDCGSLGFFIRDDDLARRDFSRVGVSVMSS